MWKSQPLHIASVDSFDTEEVFSVLKQGADMFTRGLVPDPVKLFINGQAVDAVHGLLPVNEDLTDLEYDQRLTREHAAESYLLHAFDIRPYSQKFDRKIESLREMVRTILDREQAYDRVVAEIFMGRYKETVGGIHKERCSTLHFVLRGRKRIRLWPESTWSLENERIRHSVDERTGEEEHYLLDAQIGDRDAHAVDLVGAPGDLFYWPEGWWHVGSSTGYSLSLTVAFHPRRIR
ncbi:cupin-like domain-containing protein [Paraburkholderia tropica]|uniref:cupin-like domain-containing protein n=1 Tax=Paraburkholderia tropica TaxID=92647 RepID=UPI002AB5EA11|nr:cupin-like domain-containing protein [Paraburkholderia tropica]